MIRSEVDYTNLLKLKQTILGWTDPTAKVRIRNKKQKKNEIECKVHRFNITLKDIIYQPIDDEVQIVEPAPATV